MMPGMLGRKDDNESFIFLAENLKENNNFKSLGEIL
jgi:hypothetical protein